MDEDNDIKDVEEVEPDVKIKMAHFCVECQFVEDAPGRHFTCPACGGKMMTQRFDFMEKARKQNANKRGV